MICRVRRTGPFWPKKTWDLTSSGTAELKYSTATSRLFPFYNTIHNLDRLLVCTAVLPFKDLSSNKHHATVATEFKKVVDFVKHNKQVAQANTYRDAAALGPWRELLIGDATYFDL